MSRLDELHALRARVDAEITAEAYRVGALAPEWARREAHATYARLKASGQPIPDEIDALNRRYEAAKKRRQRAARRTA